MCGRREREREGGGEEERRGVESPATCNAGSPAEPEDSASSSPSTMQKAVTIDLRSAMCVCPPWSRSRAVSCTKPSRDVRMAWQGRAAWVGGRESGRGREAQREGKGGRGDWEGERERKGQSRGRWMKEAAGLELEA